MNLKTLAALMAAASFLTLGAVHAADKASKPAEPAKPAEAAKPAEPAHAEKKVANKKTEHVTTADAAHELRTPLTAVRLQAQIAQQARSAEEREAALAQLLNGVDRASHLVRQLPDMARLAPEANRDERVPVALDALAKKVVADFSSQAEARDIDLGVGACAPLTIPAQADALRVLLGNLVDNALRYTPAGGRVNVEAVAGEGCALLIVADNGPGIPPDARERVFERFCRLAPADIPGSGLGLSLVRDIVTLHWGSVRLEGTPGGGLTVRVELPLAAEQGPPDIG